MKIAIIGGTGALGTGFAARLAPAGYEVFIGSRDPAKAMSVARRLNHLSVSGLSNAGAADAAEIILLTVPYAAHRATVLALTGAAAGKTVIDPTVPLLSARPVRLAVVEEGSAAERTQAMLPQARVVSAFQTVSADLLADLDRRLDDNVLLCGSDPSAKDTVAEVARATGLRPLDAGALEWAGTLERLGALMIVINQRYKRKHAGVRITGLGPRE
jgi:NADPH-dependent F420 reductase